MRPTLRPRTFQRHCTVSRSDNAFIPTIINSSKASIAWLHTTTSRSASITCQHHFPDIFSNNNNNNKPESIRTLRASRTLPFPPSPLYEIIASVESYSEFLPFLTASTVTARDQTSGYPSQAFLTVGYPPFTETFTSRVTCDRDRWIVEARSGGGVGDDGQPIPGADEGLFSHLSTKWELVPKLATSSSGAETEVKLEIHFRFQNPMHTAMMSAVEDRVAGVMIDAFERRIKEQMTLGR
ncbi:dehydrase family protein [Talaromyces stipitatus ATCC 10500]|uniref:Dehydrase family protein n=1 Tax=Talaromyces stipitatus (strain ATCC 10500 / CBS 375.48 / QM 6759 / NRRL 1006) TaxID=441959 RepID=B8MGF5_TALSN|nr:dehydrase family protein [Talaromyces stipitatus ATCC 10500]EED16275.1 dehydrase family protein [Talaromyces stipitatus ATCC 10500]